MRNIDYILKGYDIYEGNPNNLKGTEGDPGFRAPIFRARYDRGERTGDHRYLRPDGVIVVPCHQCEFDFHTTTISGENSYQKSLDMKVSMFVLIYLKQYCKFQVCLSIYS